MPAEETRTAGEEETTVNDPKKSDGNDKGSRESMKMMQLQSRQQSSTCTRLLHSIHDSHAMTLHDMTTIINITLLLTLHGRYIKINTEPMTNTPRQHKTVPNRMIQIIIPHKKRHTARIPNPPHEY